MDIAYTIERHLMMYAKSENTSERHQVLWHTWNANKRWLSQLLEWTLASFPTYSRHNAVHADTVLYNIERILGENRIKQLSATDCFMMLHASYMHDIGMSITAEERADMTQADRFQDLIEKLEREGDVDQKKAAQSVLRTQYTEYSAQSSRERSRHLKELFREKLDVYYGLGQLMSEYQRSLHADRVKERMNRWTLNPEELGNGFSSSGIPLRLFLRIADCAAIHATSGIEAVLELPQRDSGYVLDVVHPRFIAIMLQLGDALDIDNDRFHPFAYQFAGNFPRTSTLHLKKHQAIRQLHITPEAIHIQADCDSQDVLRIVRMECEGIDEILKNASYHWAEIAPSDMSGCLPTLSQQQILLEGQRVPGELVKAQFNISQVRAFRLLEGANVYGGHFVFLRELIQNAIDATKMQCWEDYVYKRKLQENEMVSEEYQSAAYGLSANEEEILRKVNVCEYPIELYMEIGIQIREKNEELVFIPIEDAEDRMCSEGTYGVRVMVRDHGTGITKDDLIKVSNVGSSYEEKKHFVDKMPDWLKPTGQFGIGLQSAFLVSDQIKAMTYTRNGEKYEISFNKVSNGSGGYINVKPLPVGRYVPFGTTFELFLDTSYKKQHSDCWEAWNTDSEDTDRFSSDYDKNRPLRHSVELLTQMVLSVDELLGENIFPVYVCIKGKKFNVAQYGFIKSRVKKLALDGDVEEKWLDKQQRQQPGGKVGDGLWERDSAYPAKTARKRDVILGNYVGWLFKVLPPGQEEGKRLVIVNIKDGIAALDCHTAKLHVWNSALGVFAQFGGHRLLFADSSISKDQDSNAVDERRIRIYLKGIYVQCYDMYQDSELLELIDIKGGRIDKTHIAINRNEFTKEGIRYLEEEIYPALLSAVKEALVGINEQANQRKKKDTNEKCFDERIEKAIRQKFLECREDSENEKKRIELEELVLSAIGLSYFLRVLGREQELPCERKDRKEKCHWDELLKRIVGLRTFSDKVDIQEDQGEEEDPFDPREFNQYINRGMMREMFMYSYRGLNRNMPVYRHIQTDYPSLLLEQRKIAVISFRSDSHSRWFYIPIEIYDERKGGEDYFKVFIRRTNGYQEEQEIWQELEHWADGIFNAFTGNNTFYQDDYGDDPEIQYTLKYMLENIPTVGVYADKGGNLRVNVLLGEQPESVFYNRNAKLLVLKKAWKLHNRNHAKRFMTGVWRGYSCLALEKTPSSVHVVNGAYIARQQTDRMLLPVLGENIGSLLRLGQQSFLHEIEKEMRQCKELIKLCNGCFDFQQIVENAVLGNRKRNASQGALWKFWADKIQKELSEEQKEERGYAQIRNVALSYWRGTMDCVREFMRERFADYDRKREHGIEAMQDIEQLISEVHTEQKKIQLQMEVSEFYFRQKEKEEEDYGGKQEENGLLEWFARSLYYIKNHQGDVYIQAILGHPEVQKFRDLLWGNERGTRADVAKKNMVAYVVRNTRQTMTEKQVENCYEEMFDDMIKAVIGMETDKLEPYGYIAYLLEESN